VDFLATVSLCTLLIFLEKNVEAQECLIDVLALVLILVVQVKTGIKGPLQYLFRPLLGKNEFAVTQHMYTFIGPNLDNIH